MGDIPNIHPILPPVTESVTSRNRTCNIVTSSTFFSFSECELHGCNWNYTGFSEWSGSWIVPTTQLQAKNFKDSNFGPSLNANYTGAIGTTLDFSNDLGPELNQLQNYRPKILKIQILSLHWMRTTQAQLELHWIFRMIWILNCTNYTTTGQKF